MSKIIKSMDDIFSSNFYDIDMDSFWNTGEQKELKTHLIHSYPAKFPAFISEKGLEYVAKRDFIHVFWYLNNPDTFQTNYSNLRIQDLFIS